MTAHIRRVDWREDRSLSDADRRVLERLDALYGVRSVEPARVAFGRRSDGVWWTMFRTVALLTIAAWLLTGTQSGRVLAGAVIGNVLLTTADPAESAALASLQTKCREGRDTLMFAADQRARAIRGSRLRMLEAIDQALPSIGSLRPPTACAEIIEHSTAR